MKKKKIVMNLLVSVFLSLLPTLAWSQREGVTYEDDNPASLSSDGITRLTFTVTEKTGGLQTLIGQLESQLNNDVVTKIGGLAAELQTSLSGLTGEQLVQGILVFLGVNNPTSVAIDLNTVYTAAITGPNSFSGPLTIPATVWNAANFNEDNLLNLVISQQGKSGINLGVFDEILNLGLSPDVTLGVLKGLLSISLTGGADGNSGIHVTEIADNAFKNDPAYGYQKPDADFSFNAIYVERVGIWAFGNCQHLKGSIDFTKLTNLKEVADWAFDNIHSMSGDLDLSNCKLLETIGNDAFASWDGATGVLNLSGLPNLKSIGSNAFYSGSFTSGSIDLSASKKLTTIGTGAFRFVSKMVGTLNLLGLTELTSIGNYAFDSCSKLTTGSMDISASTKLTSIGDGAFHGLTSLVGTLNLSGLVELKSIGTRAFSGCSKLTGGIDLSSSAKLETIGSYAFSDGYPYSGILSGLKGELNLSGLTSLTGIGIAAFYDANVTGDIDLSASKKLVTIGDQAFSGCKSDGVLNLTGLTNLKSIGNKAFFNMPRITGDIDLSTLTNLETIGDDCFSSSTFDGELNLFGTKLTAIPTDAFTNDYYLKIKGESFIPSGITSIGAYAFFSCAKLTGNVIIPENVTTIGVMAFVNTNMRSITFKAPAITLGKVLFSDHELEYIDLSATTLSPIPTDISRVGNLSTSTSPFCNVSSHTVIYLPAGYSGTMPVAADNYNYVIDGVCEWFYVQDYCDYYLPYGFTAKKATFNLKSDDFVNRNGYEYKPNVTRNDFRGESTVYLPFDFKLTDDTKFMAYSLKEKNNDPAVHEFRFLQHDKNDLLKANTPYMVRYIGTDAATDAFPEQENVNVPATSDCGVSEIVEGHYSGADALNNINAVQITDPAQGTWGFYGSTEKIDNTTVSGWNAYNYQYNDKMWHPITTGGAGYVAPFRAFIAGSNNAVGSKPNFTYSFEDLDGSVTTGITNLDGDEPNNNVETRIYNIGGQYVGKDFNSLPKGIYIVNGKKIMK